MTNRTRRVASAAYNRIPNPNAAQEALGLAFFLPLLIVAVFTVSALS